MNRQYTFLDKLCLGLDQAFRTLFDNPKATGRPYPGNDVPEINVDEAQRKQSAALMRINHAGEVCAQALYHGQGVVSRSKTVQASMQQAAQEEGDHLAWCKQRLDELNSHPSYLNPFWYTGSFCIGMLAGIISDKLSLGFVAETERQVVKHLQEHLQLLSTRDERSFVILQKMQDDEARHHDDAMNLGADNLPESVKKIMSWTSRIMVKTAWWI